MKKKIAGLVLMVAAIAIVLVGFILPQYYKYVPTMAMWELIFEDYFFSAVGLAVGTCIILLWKITTIKSMGYLLACFFIGLFFDLVVFSAIDILSIPGVLIGFTAIITLIASAIIFLLKGVKLMFF